MCTDDIILIVVYVDKQSCLIISKNVYVPYLSYLNDEFLVWSNIDDFEKTLDTVTL